MNKAEKNPKVAFIGHPTDLPMFKSYIRFLRSDKSYDDTLLLKLFEWTPSYIIKEWKDIPISNGKFLDAVLIMVPFLPEMRDIKLKHINEKVEEALKIAHENGCDVAALGAFTSIILQGREAELTEKYGVKLTSGNTFTAAVIIHSIECLISHLGLDLSSMSMAIIGASGDIGSGCLGYFGSKVKSVALSAKTKGSLEDLVKRMKDNLNCSYSLCNSNLEAIQKAQICIFATSAYTQIIDINDFNPGSIICDASAPLNVKWENPLREDVLLYHGGIVSIPFDVDVGFDLGLAGTNTFFGCQTEGILLALNPELPHSWGRGNISIEKINAYLQILYAQIGIESCFSLGNRIYNQTDIDKFAQYVKPFMVNQF